LVRVYRLADFAQVAPQFNFFFAPDVVPGHRECAGGQNRDDPKRDDQLEKSETSFDKDRGLRIADCGLIFAWRCLTSFFTLKCRHRFHLIV
jgi:hypothetical protein